MIAVSIQWYSIVFPMHVALPPIPTRDFDIARDFAERWMQLHHPDAYMVTYHLMRDDWICQHTLTQDRVQFSLN